MQRTLQIQQTQRIQYKVLCHTHKSLKLFTHLTSDLFPHLHLIVLLGLHLSSRLIVLLSLLVLKFQTDPSITSLLSYEIVHLLTYVILLITLPLTLASLNSQPPYFSKIVISPLSNFLSSLVCNHLIYSS
jgi:hypothetical protein